MAQQSTDLRERLLAALPQPEHLAAYREETAALLAKHARALRADYFALNVFYIVAAVLLFISSDTHWHPDPLTRHSFQFGSAFMFFVGMIYDMRYRIYKSEIGTLKEIKQVQLQVLEVQALLRKEQ